MSIEFDRGAYHNTEQSAVSGHVEPVVMLQGDELTNKAEVTISTRKASLSLLTIYLSNFGRSRTSLNSAMVSCEKTRTPSLIALRNA